MKTYNVHFTFYAEEYGQFDSSLYKVEAETPFEARRLAWLLFDKDDEMKFTSCVKQSGVTWEASPLDVQDYFNAHIAICKQVRMEYEAVALPNAEMKSNPQKLKDARFGRAYELGAIDTIAVIARDIGKKLGLQPPTVYEEMEYAARLADLLSAKREYDKAAALHERIEQARQWDASAMHSLKELLTSNSIFLLGKNESFREHFHRNGIIPHEADIADGSFRYTHRWQNTSFVSDLSRLRMFDSRDVIKDSTESMPFDYKTLVLRKDKLAPEYQTTIHMLWTPCHNEHGVCEGLGMNPDAAFLARNMITGAVAEMRREDFCGVLRPEFAENIDFEALQKQCAAQTKDENDMDTDISTDAGNMEQGIDDEMEMG